MENILEVKSVSKSFSGVRACENASLSIKRGSVTSIIGPNGAGKTSLFNLISGAISPDSGSILFNEIEIAKKHPHQIALLGLVRTFQGAKVIRRLSVMENILLAAQDNPGDRLWRVVTPRVRKRFEDEARERALELLKQVGLTSFVDSYAGILSGGQRKLLDLARAMMAQPTMLLLDEPFAGVNPALVEKLVEVLQSLKAKHDLTFLLVEHDLETVMNISDEVYVMAQGTVIASGLPNSIYDNEVVIDAYLGTRRKSN
ncbi:MAG: ABC transporter ATP-binding protein [Actinomycetes bacterium]